MLLFVHTQRKRTETWLKINMSSYQYRQSHCGNKNAVISSYLHNGISYTHKTASLFRSHANADLLSKGVDKSTKDDFHFITLDQRQIYPHNWSS